MSERPLMEVADLVYRLYEEYMTEYFSQFEQVDEDILPDDSQPW